MDFVYVFNGGRLAGGVFSSRERAEVWIGAHRLTGMPTRYPVDVGVWEWAIELGIFRVKKEKEASSEFIGSFTSASMDHWHYEDGVLMAGVDEETDWDVQKSRFSGMNSC